jgi:hypothetical protein
VRKNCVHNVVNRAARLRRQTNSVCLIVVVRCCIKEIPERACDGAIFELSAAEYGRTMRWRAALHGRRRHRSRACCPQRIEALGGDDAAAGSLLGEAQRGVARVRGPVDLGAGAGPIALVRSAPAPLSSWHKNYS